MAGDFGTWRHRRRDLALLRGMLIVAVGALLLAGGSPTWEALPLLALMALSDVVLAILPRRWVRAQRFDAVLGLIDLALVAYALHLGGALTGVLPISCLLMALVVALCDRLPLAIGGVVAVLGLHAWNVLRLGQLANVRVALSVELGFLAALGLYFGFMVAASHRARRRGESDLQEARELGTLHEILNAISTTLDLRRVFGIIVQRISAVVPTRRCSMVYVNEDRSRFFVMASHDDPDMQVLELDPDKYPEIRRAMETRQPVYIDDVSTHPLMTEVSDVLADIALHSLLVIPLTVGDEVQGLLCLRTGQREERLLQRDIDFCSAVARAAANALMISNRLRRTEKKLISILDHSSDLILTTDTRGRIKQGNRGGMRLIGRSDTQLHGADVGRLFQDTTGTDILSRVASGEVFLNHPCRLVRPDGSELKIELNTAFLRNEVQERIGVVWVARDVTELEDTQLQLLQAEKLSSVGEVISGVAHELNNPLSGVIGYSQLLMMSDARGTYRKELERICESAIRCQKIVKNLLSFSREHKPERRYLGVNGIIEKTLDLKRYQLHVNDVRLTHELTAHLPRTMLDFHQIQQVLLNLFNNAEHALANVRDRRRRLYVRTRGEGGVIRVEVEDNGEGMDRATIDHIFDPFFTTKSQGEGTGLGLSLSYGIIKEHGGEIRVRSRPGRGTTFSIELPVVVPDKASRKESSEPVDLATVAIDRRAAASILVVDDEPVILDLLIDVLGDHGHRVDTAASSEEAARKITRGDYDLVLTDIRMPRMNGMDLYREIVEKRPELRGRVLFMTGDLMSPDTERFLADNDAPALAKPLEVTELLGEIDAILKREPAELTC